MSYPINYPTPQGANVQIFNAPSRSGADTNFSWIKPQGASFVWFTLIGAGGTGDGTNGGGSGAVTNFMCPAFLIPDELSIKVGSPAAVSTIVYYQQKTGGGYNLLQANGTSNASAALANTANAFPAMGFYQSVAGQNGSSGDPGASTTTFLGGGGAAATITGNYGFTTGNNGVFMLQPLIVGLGARGNGQAGIGCGGGSSGSGGNGMAVIITW
jgi:hypothetical protein